MTGSSQPREAMSRLGTPLAQSAVTPARGTATALGHVINQGLAQQSPSTSPTSREPHRALCQPPSADTPGLCLSFPPMALPHPPGTPATSQKWGSTWGFLRDAAALSSIPVLKPS